MASGRACNNPTIDTPRPSGTRFACTILAALVARGRPSSVWDARVVGAAPEDDARDLFEAAGPGATVTLTVVGPSGRRDVRVALAPE
jgi:hypothetical protein